MNAEKVLASIQYGLVIGLVVFVTVWGVLGFPT